MKRIMYFALSFIVIISGIFGVQEKISADDDDSNFTNLIIFMRFAGEDEFIDDKLSLAKESEQDEFVMELMVRF